MAHELFRLSLWSPAPLQIMSVIGLNDSRRFSFLSATYSVSHSGSQLQLPPPCSSIVPAPICRESTVFLLPAGAISWMPIHLLAKQILPPMTAVRDVIASAPFVVPFLPRHTGKTLVLKSSLQNFNVTQKHLCYSHDLSTSCFNL